METMRPIDADKLLEELWTQIPGKTYKFCYPCKDILDEIAKAPEISRKLRRKDVIYIVALNALVTLPLLWVCLTCGGREDRR